MNFYICEPYNQPVTQFNHQEIIKRDVSKSTWCEECKNITVLTKNPIYEYKYIDHCVNHISGHSNFSNLGSKFSKVIDK
jgi:hypothetical protein